MGTFDSMLIDIENKFGLNKQKAAVALSGLLSLINEQTDGVRGFFDRFERVGLRSWLTSTKEINPTETDKLQRVLGATALGRIAASSGISLAAATSAVGFILPKLFQKIAPGGVVPSRLPAEFNSYIVRQAGSEGPGFRRANYAPEQITVEKIPDGQYAWVPLLLLAAGCLVGGWLWFARRPPQNANYPEPERAPMAQGAAPVSPATASINNEEIVRNLNLEVVHFASGSAQITDTSLDSLNRAAETIKAAPAGMKLEIVGHADSQGDHDSNMELSRERAVAVRDYLVQQGVNPEELVPTGSGETVPAASNQTAEGRFENRRIEFSVLP